MEGTWEWLDAARSVAWWCEHGGFFCSELSFVGTIATLKGHIAPMGA